MRRRTTSTTMSIWFDRVVCNRIPFAVQVPVTCGVGGKSENFPKPGRPGTSLFERPAGRAALQSGRLRGQSLGPCGREEPDARGSRSVRLCFPVGAGHPFRIGFPGSGGFPGDPVALRPGGSNHHAGSGSAPKGERGQRKGRGAQAGTVKLLRSHQLLTYPVRIEGSLSRGCACPDASVARATTS